jgi:excinuclease ABC subunit B
MQKKFELKSEYQMAGDQEEAVFSLLEGLEKKLEVQTLHGATGTGKTFSMANIIAKNQKPTLVIAHNKTLAAQLASEFSNFFPENAVHYFVSYYDYYQPEAYITTTDTFIEKEVQINKEIDMLRHASTQSLLIRDDVIIVASVSAIYGLGSPEAYKSVFKMIEVGDIFLRNDFLRSLIEIFYDRTNADLEPGKFRIIGNSLEIMPINENKIYRLEVISGKIEKIFILDAISRVELEQIKSFFLFPAKHFIASKERVKQALIDIEEELKVQLKKFQKEGKLLEAQRIERRTKYDLAMIREVGYCNGIENYSMHFAGKKKGDAPDSLLAYFPKDEKGNPDFNLFIDESHMTIPQIGGMYAGDQARKKNLIENGFRLPSAADNRPLKFDEFEKKVSQMVCVSATPGKYEKEKSQNTVRQVIRPTGLVDPVVEVRPINQNLESGFAGQVFDFIEESKKVIEGGGKILATTLTKKMAEDLSEFLIEQKIKSVYLHSEVDTLDRIKIISQFRSGKFDILVGVNLLREGLDMPEVELIGILDADKEGFLRSDTALVQTIGRAARNIKGRVILYAEKITGSMERAMDETENRRRIQTEYNKKNNITPKTIAKKVSDIREKMEENKKDARQKDLEIQTSLWQKNKKKFLKQKKEKMELAVKNLDFETAAIVRDEIIYFEGLKT